MIALEHHGMHNMQTEFITQGTLKDVRKWDIYKSNTLSKLEIQTTWSQPQTAVLQTKVKKESHEQRQMQQEKTYFRMGAHQNHTSSSDSCSRSAFLRSPTSEVQPFLSLDLINLRKKKMISGYMISRVKTLQQYADYSHSK